MDLLAVGLRGAVIGALVLALVVVHRLDRPTGGWLAPLRARFIMGVPWGTLIAILMVGFVYFVIQGALGRLYRPVTLPFYSWSYFYPVGVLMAPFAHMSFGHVLGNLLGTVVLAPLAEYYWSHFPVERGETSFARPWTNPYLRAFVVFPVGIIGVGLLTSLLHWGPVIGFSGVVYAFAGFAIVRYPVGTVLAVLAHRIVDLAVDALREPIVTAEASPSFSTPWFVDIAVQGHLLGFLAGVLLGVAVQYSRPGASRPTALRMWAATLLFGTLLSPLWAVWYIRGADRYVLHRAAGLVLIILLGVLVVLAASGRGSRFVIRLRDRELDLGVTRRQVAVLAIVIPLAVMAIVAVPINATTVDGPPAANGSVTVRDYTVTYAENVVKPKTSVIDVSLLGERTTVRTGGVIVTSDDRELWSRVVSPGRLAFQGEAGVRLGGVGWRKTVIASRTGWSLLEGGSTYRVDLRPPDGSFKTVYTADAATAGITVSARNISIAPVQGGFEVRVKRNETVLARASVPARGESVTVAGFTFHRQETRLVVRTEGTRIPIATAEPSD